MRLAFAGFRHGHILDLYELAGRRPDVEIVAASEDDEGAREKVAGRGVEFTHRDYGQMLREVDCDAVAIGDYYGRRGEVAIAALGAGRHVIADKPLCTRSVELGEITRISGEKGLCVGCMLTMRDSGVFRTMRRLIGEGAIGDVHTVVFTGQHPLSYGGRPGWYFEEGKHGGTINDIAIHAMDSLPWMTGRRLKKMVAARVWNARLAEAPFFQDGAQMMLELDNGGGVLGDVSYLAPEEGGYSARQYWRTTCHGSEGVIEGSAGDGTVWLWAGGKVERIEPEGDVEGGYFEAFRREIAGESAEGELDTAQVLESTRKTLVVQEAAESSRRNVAF